jgi:hypothetical protein
MTSMVIPYVVDADDVLPEEGHIGLVDSKTHQFFAFRGAVVSQLPRYELQPHDPATTAPLVLPTWIDRDDLERAEAANLPTIAPDFHAADVGDDLLHSRSDLAPLWLAIGPGEARVPITMDQAMLGVRWDVSAVPPGLYQIAGFTFSPPYNAWEPRPGWIKIIDDTPALPAVTVDAVDASLFDGQGRRISGCVNAPEGSTLRASFSLEGAADPSWQPFAERVPIAGGSYELCLRSPRPGLAGMARVRVAITDPDGSETVAYAPDRLVMIGTPAPCTPSLSVCCEAQPPPVTAQGPAAAPAEGMMPAVAGAPAPTSPAASQPMAAATSGCSVARAHGAGGGSWLGAAWLLCVGTLLSRRWATCAARRPAGARSRARMGTTPGPRTARSSRSLRARACPRSRRS